MTDQTPARLREPAHLVSPRAKLLWTIGGLITVLLLVVAPQVIWWRFASEGPHLPVAMVTGLLALAYLVVMPQWRYRVHRWEATPTAIYTQSGWFNQERRIAPLSRVQTVDVTRGPLAQLLGLASVRITTASAAGAVSISGLRSADADELSERLTQAAAASRDDAT